MAGPGPITSQDLAIATGCAERYIREWLNAHAASDYVRYHVERQSCELTPEQAFVLADEDSPSTSRRPGTSSPRSGPTRPNPCVPDRRGRELGRPRRAPLCGAAFYRIGYRASLVREWLPALDGVTAKLSAGAQIADVGCGHGHPAIIMAEAFPNSRSTGFETHVDRDGAGACARGRTR